MYKEEDIDWILQAFSDDNYELISKISNPNSLFPFTDSNLFNSEIVNFNKNSLYMFSNEDMDKIGMRNINLIVAKDAVEQFLKVSGNRIISSNLKNNPSTTFDVYSFKNYYYYILALDCYPMVLLISSFDGMFKLIECYLNELIKISANNYMEKLKRENITK